MISIKKHLKSTNNQIGYNNINNEYNLKCDYRLQLLILFKDRQI